MKYRMSVAIDGRIDIDIEADSFEEAKQKMSLDDVDLSAMDVIKAVPVNAEDENGVFKDY